MNRRADKHTETDTQRHKHTVADWDFRIQFLLFKMTVFIANAILDKCCIRQIVLIMFCVWFSENWDSIGYFFHTERFCLFSSILTDENSFIYLSLWRILRITGDLFSKYPLLFGRPKSQLLVIECSVRPSFSGDGLSVATVHSLAADWQCSQPVVSLSRLLRSVVKATLR